MAEEWVGEWTTLVEPATHDDLKVDISPQGKRIGLYWGWDGGNVTIEEWREINRKIEEHIQRLNAPASP